MIRGFTSGTFDLFHAGHVLMFKQAKQVCDYLIIGLHVNPKVERKFKNKPVESLYERQIKLLGSKYVDEVWCYETEAELENMLITLDLDVRFVGMDYANHPEKITGKDIVPIEFTPREHSYSSSELRKRLK